MITDSAHQFVSGIIRVMLENMNANLKSIILMIIAMGCLTLTDMLIKIASQTLPIGQVMIFYGVGALVVFWGLLSIKNESFG